MEDITTKEMTGLDDVTGGSNFSNKGKKQDTKTEAVKTYSAYKYSTGIPLAEQIILGNKSVFLQIDEVSSKPVISLKLDLSKEQSLVLIPSEDGISGLASFTLAIRFMDLNEIKHYIEQAKKETIDSIYMLHKSIWEKFVVASDDYSITFLAIDSVYSQLQDLFETTHYDYIHGAPGSGKGVKMIVFKLLGYRVVLVTDLSGANVLDLYGSIERNQITIAEDELDDIEDDKIKQKIYKVGADLTGTTTRTLDGNTSNRTNRLYKVFGFKIFGTESPSDSRKLGGWNDRNFRIPSIKGKPEFRIKKVLLEMEKPVEKQNPKYRLIIRNIDYVRKLTLIFRMIHHDDQIEEVETNIDGRPLELTGPQVYLFASKALGSSYALATTTTTTKEERKNSLLIKEILPALSHFLKEKGQLAEKTREGMIYDALKQLVESEHIPNELEHEEVIDVLTNKKTHWVKVAYERIYDKVMVVSDATPSTTPNEHAMYSVEYGKITHRSITYICRKPFGAEPGGLGSMDKKVKAMRFDRDLVHKVGKSFEVIDKIKILHPDDDGDDDDDNNDAANKDKNNESTEGQKGTRDFDDGPSSVSLVTGTEGRNENEDFDNEVFQNGNEYARITSDRDRGTELGQIQGINENAKEDSKNEPQKNNEDITLNQPEDIRNIQNKPIDSQDTANRSTAEEEDENGLSISGTASNSVPQSLPKNGNIDEDPPPWVKENRGWTHEEAEGFKARVADLGKAKAAAAATTEANLSGDSVLLDD